MTTKPNKKILITGISRGLGQILSQYLSKHNCEVYGTVRSLDDFTDSKLIKYIPMDLQVRNSIDHAVSEVFQKIDTLDAVIHNAGIAYLNPADEMSEEERRQVFDINFFGPIYLTELLLPYFRKANKGKIIFISSIASLDPWPGLGVYSASKAAIERVAFEWSVLLKKWNIHTSVIRPNPLPTDMQILKSLRSEPGIYGPVFCNELVWEKTEDVCDLILKIISEKAPHFEYATGEFSMKTVNSILKKGAHEKLIRKYRRKLGLL